MPAIETARVLKGARPFSATGNINDTYRGFVLLANNSRRHGIIKDLNLAQLINELLATVLAKELSLPVPDGYLGIVPSGDLPVKKLPLKDGTGSLVFISADVQTPNLTQQLQGKDQATVLAFIDHLKSWLNLGPLYAFDAWIANTDRHMGNLLIDGPSNIWLIDHGHAFTGPNWSVTDLEPVADYRHKLQEWLTACLSPDEKNEKGKEVGQFAIKATSVSIPQALAESHTERLLSPQACAALKGFLERRVQDIPAHAKRALGIPVLVS